MQCQMCRCAIDSEFWDSLGSGIDPIDRDRGIGHIRTTQTNLERTEEPAEVAAVALNSKLNFQLSTGHILAAPVCISISRSTTVI